MNERETHITRLRDGLYVAGAVAIWFSVAFSLGWYYTFTYYGRAGWAIPMPEPCAALVLYYFSVLNVRTELQAAHWIVVFPIAGGLWALALVVTARLLKLNAPHWSKIFVQLSWPAIPVAIPGPWMAWTAGIYDDHFTWSRMVAVALRRGNVDPWSWLSLMYFALGLVGLGIQIALYRRLFPVRTRWQRIHYPLAMVMLVLASSVFAALIAIPLRWSLE